MEIVFKTVYKSWMSPVYSVIDIETTGAYKNGAKITEIAILNFDGVEVVDEFSTLVNPEQHIPWHITKLTGITNEMVAGAPKFYEIAKKIVQMTEGNTFIAHNVFFDFNFIKHEFSELGFSFQRDKLCSVRLARQFLPGHKSYSLGKICQDLGIQIKGRHRAKGDALATIELLKKIIEKKPNALESKRLEEKGKINLPTYIERSTYEKLPHLPGVYYFYNRGGELIYIGKSKDIKKRVGSHFRVDIKRKKDVDLKKQIAHIDYQLTGNELAALLLECHEIKSLRPRFNHSLKRTRFPVRIDLIEANGVFELRPVFRESNDDSFFVFTTTKRAQKKIDTIYKSLLGADRWSPEFNQKRQKYINIIGKKEFNNFLKKSLRPKTFWNGSKAIKLRGIENGECVIKIQNTHPTVIEYYSKDGTLLNSISLKSDQDMRNILINYVSKHNLSVN